MTNLSTEAKAETGDTGCGQNKAQVFISTYL